MFKQPQMPTLSAATLVMDSRKTLVSVRHQNLTGSWSQLYKSGDVYLDLSLRSEASGSTLLGHLVADPSQLTQLGGMAVLQKDQNTELSATVNSTGSFRLPLNQSGVYRLEVVLQDQIIFVDRLEV